MAGTLLEMVKRQGQSFVPSNPAKWFGRHTGSSGMVVTENYVCCFVIQSGLYNDPGIGWTSFRVPSEILLVPWMK